MYVLLGILLGVTLIAVGTAAAFVAVTLQRSTQLLRAVLQSGED